MPKSKINPNLPSASLSKESDLKNAAIHFGKALSSMVNLTKIIIVGHDAKAGVKLVRQTFNQSFEPKKNTKEAQEEQEKYDTEIKSYLSKSVKSGFSELKNIAVELSSSCFSLVKSLAKGVVAGVSSLHSTTTYFKSKLQEQKNDAVEKRVLKEPEGPRLK